MKKLTKKGISSLLIPIVMVSYCLAQTTGDAYELIRIEALPGKGFSYPYFLYIPKTVHQGHARRQKYRLLVVPNNTGETNDDLAVHEKSAKNQILDFAELASKLNAPLLMPVFPRPKTDWQIYTHALDRDSLTTHKKEYARFDLQLIAMIDHAREKLKNEDIKVDKRVFITGFSASGMFADRFTFLHPERVKAVAAGSPGGWAIVPIDTYEEKALRYPIGVSDLGDVAGKKLDLRRLRKVPILIYMGDKDTNDSVVYSDGYDREDRNLIFELFGKTPVERWEINQTLYTKSGLRATFKLYPGADHSGSDAMIADVVEFFNAHK